CRFLIFFFFSSRRRHTRSKRDWSSDVCSSDLNGYVEGENIEFESLSAQGAQDNLNPMAEQIVETNDMILSLGTATTQALANAEQEKPIIFTAVTDPVDSGLVDSQETPGKNITGSSDYMPIDKQIDLLLSLGENAKS